MVFVAVALAFLLTAESRVKRKRALGFIKELGALAHLVDMHQLTEDPHRMTVSTPDTESSPRRELTTKELGRYLDAVLPTKAFRPIVHPTSNPGVRGISLPSDGAASSMTELLRKAFEQASKLPPGEQDALASVLLDELEGEHLWDRSLEETPDQLAGLAEAALAEHRADKTQPLDPDKL